MSDLDFSDLPTRYASEIETVALFVVLREVVRKVDQIIAPMQDVAEAARKTRAELLDAQPELQSDLQSVPVRRKGERSPADATQFPDGWVGDVL